MARASGNILVLDIETVADRTRWAPDGDAADGDRAGFPPTWAHRVVAIGCLWLDRRYRLVDRDVLVHAVGGDAATDAAGDADAGERALIAAWSHRVGAARPMLVTYNGRRFDLPVLALRALAHGVPLGWYYREPSARHRYTEDGHLDLCDALSDHGAARSSSLDALSKLIGLPGKLGVDGSHVDGMYQRGELAAIASYCLQDVVQTALLLLRYRLLQGRLGLVEYRAAARGLLDGLAGDARLAELLAAVDVPRLLVPAEA